MELFFGEFIKQLIAAIMAIFMPFSTLTAAAPKPVREHINTNHAAYETVCEGADLQAIESWDTGDGTRMSYYDADENTVLDSITSSIRALFVPMTAYAAEETEQQVIENGKTYKDGTVVITGNGGDTDPYLFMKWLKPDAVVKFYEEYYQEVYGATKHCYVSYDDIDENGNILEDGISAAQAHREYSSNAELLKHYFPTAIVGFICDTPDFWDAFTIFNPKTIIFDGDFDSIGFAAFAFCTNVTSIQFTGEVKEIKSAAFATTRIASITLPEGLTRLEQCVFANCIYLKDVYLPTTLQVIGNYTFNDMPDNSTIHCAESITDLLHNPNLPTPYSAVEVDDYCNDNFNIASDIDIIEIN